MQVRWKAILDPVVASPIPQGRQVAALKLSTGPNVIQHKLGREYVGWFLVDKDGVADVYADSHNSAKATSIVLVSSAPVTVSFWIF